MRATLLTAQRMADSIVKEAEQKRDQMMTQAEIDAKMKITRLKNETAANEERLRQSQAELEKFSAAIRAVCDKEIQLLEELPQRPVETPREEAEEDSPVQEIEDHVLAAFGKTEPDETPEQPEEQAAVQQSLSATDVREMQQADAAVTALTGGSDYAQMTEGERTDAALQQLDALTAQGLVKQGSVYTDAENGMISFTYSCGALGGILLTDPEEENTAALPELDESRLQELAENKRVGTAAIYYAFDNTINSTRYPYYAYMQTYWDSVGLQTDLDTTVTVSDLRRMGRYDLCILSTHGAYYTYEYGWLFKKTATEPLILLTERSDFWSDLRYGFD